MASRSEIGRHVAQPDVAGLRANDPRAWENFDRANRGRLILAARAGGSDAEDAVQEALLRAWMDRNRLDSDKNVVGFAKVIARNKALDLLRTKASRARVELNQRSEVISTTEMSVEEEALRGVISNEVSKRINSLTTLTPEQVEALLFTAAELTVKQVAEVTKVPLGTAKSRVRDGKIKAARSLYLFDPKR